MTSKHLVAETQRQTERYAQGWFPVDLEAIDPVVREKREIEHLRAFASKGKEAGGEGGPCLKRVDDRAVRRQYVDLQGIVVERTVITPDQRAATGQRMPGEFVFTVEGHGRTFIRRRSTAHRPLAAKRDDPRADRCGKIGRWNGFPQHEAQNLAHLFLLSTGRVRPRVGAGAASDRHQDCES